MLRFIVLSNLEMVLRFESVDDPNESYLSILSCCTVYHAEQSGSVAIQMKVIMQKQN